MIKLNAVVSYGLCFSLWFFTGCSSSNEPEPVNCDNSDLEILVETQTNPSSCNSGDGSITVSATGGKSPYTFSLNGGTFSASTTFEDLGAGTYAIEVKDKNGCLRSIETELTIPGENPLTASADISSDTECLTSNGSIQVIASGGAPPYQFKIGSGSFSDVSLFSGLAPGNYSLSIKDSEGCLLTLAKTVDQGNSGVTYDGHILQIFETKCDGSGCHPGNGDWFTYSTAKASQIKTRIQNNTMPPGGGLTAAEKALIVCWVDGGAIKN